MSMHIIVTTTYHYSRHRRQTLTLLHLKKGFLTPGPWGAGDGGGGRLPPPPGVIHPHPQPPNGQILRAQKIIHT